MLITAQSHAITYIVNIRLCTPTKHEYTEVNTCVVCGVLAEQTVYSRYFSKKASVTHSKYYEFSISIAVPPSWLFAEAEIGWKIHDLLNCSSPYCPPFSLFPDLLCFLLEQ